MGELTPNMSAEARVNMAIDASNRRRADELVYIAKQAGAQVVKLGLELSSAIGWRDCADVAEYFDIDWVADAKIDDIPNTTKGAVANLARLKHPPVGITIHTKSGIKSMAAAQEAVDESGIMMIGVTHLTSINDDETLDTYGMTSEELVVRLAHNAVEAGIGGLVCSASELSVVKSYAATKGLFTMIPGTRSAGADVGDQARVMTPEEAISNGADLLVIGRQITNAEDPAQAYRDVVAEINYGLATRNA